jgi:hypothetical protein
MKKLKTIDDLRDEFSHAEMVSAIPNLHIYIDHLIVDLPFEDHTRKKLMAFKLKDYIKENFEDIENIQINYIDINVIETMVIWHKVHKIKR